MRISEMFSQIYSEWGEAISATSIGDNYYPEPSEVVTKLPCATLHVTNASDVGFDLANQGSGVSLSLQVDIYIKDTDRLSHLWELEDVSYEALSSLGFRRTSTLNTSQSTDGYKRCSSRYTRQIGYGDPLLKGE